MAVDSSPLGPQRPYMPSGRRLGVPTVGFLRDRRGPGIRPHASFRSRRPVGFLSSGSNVTHHRVLPFRRRSIGNQATGTTYTTILITTNSSPPKGQTKGDMTLRSLSLAGADGAHPSSRHEGAISGPEITARTSRRRCPGSMDRKQSNGQSIQAKAEERVNAPRPFRTRCY